MRLLPETNLRARAILGDRLGRLVQSVRSKRWQWLTGVILGGAVYAYIAARIIRDWRTLDLSAFQLRYDLLGLSWVMHTVGTFLAIWTWMLLLRQMGYAIPLRRHVKVYTTANLARRLPGFVWWLVGRAYMYDRDGVSKLETSAGAFLELLLTAAAAASVALITLLVAPSNVPTVNPLVLVALFVGFLVLLHPRLFSFVRRKLRVSTHIPDIAWYHLILWFALQMIVVTLGGMALYWMMAAIYPVSSTALLGSIQGWSLLLVSGTILVWLPIDFGISNGILILILSTFLPTPVAAIVMVAWRWWIALCELLWGVFGLLLPAPRR